MLVAATVDGIGGRVDGWADASSNVLPVIERRLKVDDGNFGVPLRRRLLSAGTWTSPHRDTSSWTRSWSNRTAEKETSVDETFASDFRTVYISARTRDEEFGIFRSRFNAELYNLSFYNRILETLDQFIYIYQNLCVKFRLGGRFGEGERFCKKGVWIKGESFIKPSVCSMIKIAVVCNQLSACRNNRCGLIPDSNFSPCTMLAKIVWKKKKNRKLKLVPMNVRTSEIFFIPQIFPSFS